MILHPRLAPLLLCTGFAISCGEMLDQPEPALLTRAERTDYRETTSHSEVVELMHRAASRSPDVHFTDFGYTMEGRTLPLAVVGSADGSPSAIRASGKLRVYLQANIHGGEVCGKEALLMLLRSIVEGERYPWRSDLVLLMAPIYNADGNEKVALTNRPRQHGPLGGMGERRNAQGLDLNRDHMKLETPEARSLVTFLHHYDPHLAVDLHATNGTLHAYHLTYAPPLHPNTHPQIIRLLRQDWLPAITRELSTAGWNTYYYGNLPWPGSNAERGWYTFDHRPRFHNNYLGLRNRVAILSEAYAYSSFRQRVEATLAFVEAILLRAGEEADRIRRLANEADESSIVGQKLAVRAAVERSQETVDILMGEVESQHHPLTGGVMLLRKEVEHPESMPEFGTFSPSAVETVPRAYLVPASLDGIVERLRVHGIQLTELEAEETLQVERFEVTESRTAERPFEGHLERTVEGAYTPVEVTVPAGTYRAAVDQPLGRLLFSLLEPRSDDGLLNWNLFDESMARSSTYPILRIPAEARTNQP